MIVVVTEDEVFIPHKPAQSMRYWNAANRANQKAEKYGCEGRLTLQDVKQGVGAFPVIEPSTKRRILTETTTTPVTER